MKYLAIILFSISQVMAGSWLRYSTDYCTESKSSDLSRANGNKCKDGSVSFDQPGALGMGGYEGKCGQTMAANIFYGVCSVALSPKNYWDVIMNDVTPGSHPRTVTSGLNSAFNKYKAYCPSGQGISAWYIKLGNAKNFIQRIKEYLKPMYSSPGMLELYRNGERRLRNPVGALIKAPGDEVHWVTVVDQIQKNGQCHFVVNHWSNQYELPCTKLAEWSGNLSSYGVLLRPYQVVTFKKR